MFDYLMQLVTQGLSKVTDHREVRPKIELTDVLLSAFAMFSIKDPSLLSFVDNYPHRKENLEQVYGISTIPSEQGLRKILDPVHPDELMPSFKTVLADEKVGEVLADYECFKALGGYTAMAVDGTGYFSSNNVRCPHCLVKKYKSGDHYHHQMAGCCIVHPDRKAVLPVFAEPITKQDGKLKNDCEYNAFKRLVPKIKRTLPEDSRPLILLDGLFASAPAIRLMLFYSMDFITVIKEGYVLIQVERLAEQNKLQRKVWYEDKHIKCTAQWTEDLILNGKNQDLLVNYVEYEQVDTRTGKVLYRGKWITSLPLRDSLMKEFVKTARARWKIENETFNVLKKHGYQLEHNYGHGKQFLSSVLALVMFLAFLVDQLTSLLDATFQKALKAAKTLRDLRQKVRVLFDLIPCISMNMIYLIIARERKIGLSP